MAGRRPLREHGKPQPDGAPGGRLQRILVGLLSLSVAAVLLWHLLGQLQQGRWQQAEFTTSVYRLGEMALLTHAEWLRQGRGDSVILRHADTAGIAGEQRIAMSERGWPLPYEGASDSEQAGIWSHNACIRLWQLLVGSEPEPQRVLTQWHSESRSCEYRLRHDIAAYYRVESGHLTLQLLN